MKTQVVVLKTVYLDKLCFKFDKIKDRNKVSG